MKRVYFMKNTKKKAQSLIEYGLILALVAVVAVTILSKFGKTMTSVAEKTNTDVTNVSNNALTTYCASLATSIDQTNCTNAAKAGT